MGIRTFTLSLVFTLGSLLVSHAFAQEVMPDHVKTKLSALVGEWTMEAVSVGEPTTLEVAIRWAPSKMVLVYDWSGTDLSGEKNSGSGMLGWDAGKKAVVEQELDSDGSSISSTHCISEDGKWVVPTTGTVVVEGQAKHLESVRIFEIKSKDEWTVKSTNRFLDNEQQPDIMSTFNRK